MDNFKPGDPRKGDTGIGPIVSQRQWERVQSYIHRGIEEGARLVVGGPGRPEGLSDSYCVRPTIFADVTNDMTIAREEIFGPVLSILSYRDEDDALQIANDTTYGKHPTCAQGCSRRRLGGGSGRGDDLCCLILRLSGLPIPGKQLVDFLCRMIRQFGEHEGEPRLGVDVV